MSRVGLSNPKSGANMKKVKERFYKKIEKVGECHEWTGHVMINGYGQFSKDGRAQYAHRVAYELAKGEIKDNLYVLHKCDNRKCVNPDHLFLGTFDDNMADMVIKQRQAHGMNNAHAKLTDSDVLEIRSMEGTNRAIADKFNVSQPLISMIRNRRIWKLV